MARTLTFSVPNIYQFEDFSAFLRELRLIQRKKSLATWANWLGYRSQRSMGMLLSGERSPSQEFVERLSRFLQLDERRHRYLELLARMKRAGQNRSALLNELALLRPKEHKGKSLISSGEITQLAHWHHYAIRQLMGTRDFIGEEKWIYSRLGGRVSAKKIRHSLDAMEQMGFIERCEAPKNYRLVKEAITTADDVPAEAVRMHHYEQLVQASRALKTHPVKEREFLSLCLAFDSSRVTEAKLFLRRMKDDFDRNFSAKDGNEVYQCNIQFFSHTKREDS